MPIVVEDGTGLANAQSYVSVAEADSFFNVRDPEQTLFPSWFEQNTAGKEALLVRATEALDVAFRGRWKGTKKTSTQALAWPRLEVTDEEELEVPSTIVPTPVKRATFEVAVIEITERFNATAIESSEVVSESVGPISVTYKNSGSNVKVYPHINLILSGLASVGGGALGVNIGLTDEEKNPNQSFDPFDYPDYFNLVKDY